MVRGETPPSSQENSWEPWQTSGNKQRAYTTGVACQTFVTHSPGGDSLQKRLCVVTFASSPLPSTPQSDRGRHESQSGIVRFRIKLWRGGTDPCPHFTDYLHLEIASGDDCSGWLGINMKVEMKLKVSPGLLDSQSSPGKKDLTPAHILQTTSTWCLSLEMTIAVGWALNTND